jgi:hypothetical protein
MSFSEFYKSLLNLSKSYEEKNTCLQINFDEESDLIKIFGEKITAISKAKNGLDDVFELSCMTAEHHPFWNLLYRCSEISKTVLDKWDSELTKNELDEIQWSIDELKNTCDNLKEKLNDDL